MKAATNAYVVRGTTAQPMDFDLPALPTVKADNSHATSECGPFLIVSGVRIPALISGAILAVMVLALVIGNAIQAAGVVRNPTALETPVKIVFFALFVLFGFSLIPVIVKVVLAVQVALGNGNFGPIKAAVAYSNWIVAILWSLMAAGLIVALPTAIRQGFFGK